MLSLVEHKKRFITSGPGLGIESLLALFFQTLTLYLIYLWWIDKLVRKLLLDDQDTNSLCATKLCKFIQIHRHIRLCIYMPLVSVAITNIHKASRI